jgi:hypothetical protein
MSLNNLKNIKKIILSDSVNGKWKEKILSEDKGIELAKTDYTESLQAFKNNQIIYRGEQNLENRNIYEINPELRKSRGTLSNNIYTILFSEILPSWSKYPKRNHCIIGSTSENSTFMYGETFIVLPKDGSKLAIAPYHDFWNSFTDSPYIYIQRLNKFSKDINIIFSYICNENYDYIDKDVILYWFNEVAPKFFKDKSNIDKLLFDIRDKIYFPDMLQMFLENNDNLIKFFDNILNPNNNGFEIIPISDYKIKNKEYAGKPREIWFDNTCLIISKNYANYLFR